MLAKYSGREKRRVNDIIHRATKLIAHRIGEENLKPVMEKLTNIRKRIKYGRKMNRRLHSMPFRKIQSFKPDKVNAKNTSKMCPICGEINEPNGHFFKCKRCKFQVDRHFVAALNIATKLQMWGALPLPPKAVYEAFEAEAERIVIKC